MTGTGEGGDFFSSTQTPSRGISTVEVSYGEDSILNVEKAKTILWTCDSNTHLEQDCDLTVYIHSSEPNHLRISTTSRIATLYLIDLIYFTYVNNKNLKLENYTDI